MFCPKCGSQLADGTKFCPKCGAALGNNVGTPASGAPNQFNNGQGVPQPQGVNYTPSPIQPKKNNKGLFIGLGVAAVAIVIALILFFTGCLGGGKGSPAGTSGDAVVDEKTEEMLLTESYIGTWEGTATYQGVTVDCTLQLNEDESAEMKMSFAGKSETMDNLQWRTTDDGIEVATENKDDWTEFERDGDALVIDQSGIEIEVTKK